MAHVRPRTFGPALALAAIGFAAATAHAFADGDKATLGRLLFFDTGLSQPTGQSCASCHAPAAGFKFPNSAVNLLLGVPHGAIPTRFGPRAAPTISYAAFSPFGPVAQPRPGMIRAGGEILFFGGLFWDGHASDLMDQARQPFFNANEMNNLVHNLPSTELLVAKVSHSPEAGLFRQVYGAGVFAGPASAVLEDVTDAIAEYERTPEVSPFSSKYDDYVAGLAALTPAELDGLRLVTGTYSGRPGGKPYPRFAQCILCHGIPQANTGTQDLWTDFCYANIGTPRNYANPFYFQTNANTNPVGYNPAGTGYVDLGLGGLLYPRSGLPAGNMGPGSNGYGDFLQINGAFKAPTLRNVDKRPHPGFVKAYMHNGAFKDLRQVVHFYNTRNLTTWPGEVIDFTQEHPYAHLRGIPLWPPPEVSSPESLQNPAGDRDGQIGNLGLTPQEEDHIVAFLKTLTDR